MAEVVDPVGHADAVEACRQIEEHPSRTVGARRTAHQEAHHAPGIAVERNPAVGIYFLEEKIDRLPNLQLLLPIPAPTIRYHKGRRDLVGLHPKMGRSVHAVAISPGVPARIS